MITKDGYSKDKSIQPEGIVITFGEKLITYYGGLQLLLRDFQFCMRQHESSWWHQKCRNKPVFEIDHVYIVVENKLYGRVLYGGYKPAGSHELFTWPHIILAGPLEKAPVERELKGFRGFRYCTKLF
ncbi:MAG TPA: hypothetical protein VF609_13280 [Flavisolibacter sp.]|jgi:hypothetical protein